MKEQDLPLVEHIEYFKADDGRIVGMFIGSDFHAYEAFPPYVTDAGERAFISQAYELGDVSRERNTKAHVTPDAFPLQITLLNRDPGAVVRPHYHEIFAPYEGKYRHQIMICHRGKAKIGVYTVEGQHVGDAILNPFDLILLTEGHRIEFIEPGTKMIEVKQGPIPEAIADEMVVL